MNRRIALTALVAGAALASVAAACGGSTSSSATPTASSTPAASSAQGATQAQPASTPASGTTLQLTADASGAPKFDQTSLTAPAGKVTIDLTNPSSVGHDIAITGNGVDVVGKTVQGGGMSTVTADLQPGTYTFYCSVDGHRDAGMQGTLTVQ